MIYNIGLKNKYYIFNYFKKYILYQKANAQILSFVTNRVFMTVFMNGISSFCRNITTIEKINFVGLIRTAPCLMFTTDVWTETSHSIFLVMFNKFYIDSYVVNAIIMENGFNFFIDALIFRDRYCLIIIQSANYMAVCHLLLWYIFPYM